MCQVAQDVLDSIRGDRAVTIAASVEALIETGRLAADAALPPVRELARRLGVSPTTVAAAYRELRSRGLVTAGGRRGTRVAVRGPLPHRGPAPVPPGVRDLTHGNPDRNLLPDLSRVLPRLRPRQHLYGEPPYNARLLELLGRDLTGDGISAGSLLVVGGALDGIERVLTARLRAGDRVLVEDPGYPAIHDLLLALGLVPEPVPVDERGYLPEALEAALRRSPAALISTPRAQNPTGAVIDEARADELRRLLAGRPDVLLLEDDHAGMVAGAPLAALSAAPPRRWAFVRSVSKPLGPDLRLAVMAGDGQTVARVEGRQELGVGWVSHLLQELVVALLEDPDTLLLLRTAAAAYAERRRALVQALAERGWSATGRSGFNVWISVPDEESALRRLLDAGWAAAPGERFRHRTGPGIRVSIGSLLPEDAPRLAEALSVGGERRARTRSA
jgi:DNA-binding transcriptional MocR family regulator